MTTHLGASPAGPEAPDDDLLPIRALNDLLFCERRCALHFIEGLWMHNQYTAEGVYAHRRADRPAQYQVAPGTRAVHGMWLKSHRLRLVGKADVVEFRAPGLLAPRNDSPHPEPAATAGPHVAHTVACGSGENEGKVPYPVDYKRGRRRRWDNDDVQLCAQALCLEEMLGVSVPAGAIFHVKSKRRREVLFTPELRAKTEAAARRLHELVAQGRTPPARYKTKCRRCSLLELCLPKAMRPRATAARYLAQAIAQTERDVATRPTPDAGAPLTPPDLPAAADSTGPDADLPAAGDSTGPDAELPGDSRDSSAPEPPTPGPHGPQEHPPP